MTDEKNARNDCFRRHDIFAIRILDVHMEQMISRGTAGFETWTHVAALSLLRMGFYESYLVGKGSRGVLGVANYTTKGSAYVGTSYFCFLFFLASFYLVCSFAFPSTTQLFMARGGCYGGYHSNTTTPRRGLQEPVWPSEKGVCIIFILFVFIVKWRGSHMRGSQGGPTGYIHEEHGGGSYLLAIAELERRKKKRTFG